MVREVEMSGVIEQVDFQKAFGILYGDGKFQKRYHKEISKDPAANITEWSREGRREVKFAAPVSAPKVVQMLLEVQQYTKLEDSVIIKSEPIIDAPGGSSFRTFGKVTLAPGDTDRSCRVTMVISLECTAGLWGVQGTVEGYMETHARRSFEGWMRIARIFCQEELGLTQHGPGFEDDDEETFFDLEDVRDDGSVSGSETGSSGSTGSLVERVNIAIGSSSDARLGVDMWFVQSVLKELNGLQISGDASRTHLEKLNVKLQKIEDELFLVKSHLEKQNRRFIQATWGVVALSIAIGLIIGVRRLCLRTNRNSFSFQTFYILFSFNFHRLCITTTEDSREICQRKRLAAV